MQQSFPFECNARCTFTENDATITYRRELLIPPVYGLSRPFWCIYSYKKSTDSRKTSRTIVETQMKLVESSSSDPSSIPAPHRQSYFQANHSFSNNWGANSDSLYLSLPSGQSAFFRKGRQHNFLLVIRRNQVRERRNKSESFKNATDNSTYLLGVYYQDTQHGTLQVAKTPEFVIYWKNAIKCNRDRIRRQEANASNKFCHVRHIFLFVNSNTSTLLAWDSGDDAFVGDCYVDVGMSSSTEARRLCSSIVLPDRIQSNS